MSRQRCLSYPQRFNAMQRATVVLLKRDSATPTLPDLGSVGLQAPSPSPVPVLETRHARAILTTNTTVLWCTLACTASNPPLSSLPAPWNVSRPHRAPCCDNLLFPRIHQQVCCVVYLSYYDFSVQQNPDKHVYNSTRVLGGQLLGNRAGHFLTFEGCSVVNFDSLQQNHEGACREPLNGPSGGLYLGDGGLKRLRVGVERALALPRLLPHTSRQPLASSFREDDSSKTSIFFHPLRHLERTHTF